MILSGLSTENENWGLIKKYLTSRADKTVANNPDLMPPYQVLTAIAAKNIRKIERYKNGCNRNVNTKAIPTHKMDTK
jgi:hypothetical protein